MAEFIVRNSLNPNKAAKLGITYTHLTPKGYEGESMWFLEVATDELDVNGNSINPVFIDDISSRTLDEEIAKAVSLVAAQIDWSPLVTDRWSPTIESMSPATYEVDIDSSLEIDMKDILPSAGIDLSSINLTINEFDVTNELSITGDPYRYKIKWHPFLRIYEEE